MMTFNIKMKFVDYVLRSCKWLHAMVIWLMGLVTMTLQLPSFLDTDSVEYLIVCWGGILNGNLVKNLPTNELDWRGKPRDKWEYSSPIGKLINLKGSCCWWKTSQPSYERLRRKTRQEINQWKTFELDEEMWEENQKIIVIINEKTFQPGLRIGKEKPRVVEGEKICSIRDLVNEGLEWWKTWMMRNLVRIRCCVVLQESNCQWSNCHCRLPDAPYPKETDLRLFADFWL